VQPGGFVYILASRKQGTLYIGVTSDIVKRMSEHRADLTPGFTSRYGVKRLVWMERHDEITLAIQREKAMKKWNRGWKVDLIETANPDWDDLAVSVLGFAPLAFAPQAGDGPPRSRG
jgi:putative endonuclease